MKRLICLLMLSISTLLACAGEPELIEVTRIETEFQEVVVTEVVTRIVDGEPEMIPVTRVVEVEVAVTDTPATIPEGGTIITSGRVRDLSLNPILGADSGSSGTSGLMFLRLISTDPFSGALAPEIAERWEVSDDGLVYTFFLRDDIAWSDGVPLTAHDVIFTFDAINTPEVQSPDQNFFATVESWTAVDDFTVEIKLSSVDCTTLFNINSGIIPAHVYNHDPLNIIDSPENRAPSVVSGIFDFAELQQGEFIRLIRNDHYYLGPTHVDGVTIRHIDDPAADFSAFLAGETDYTSVPPEFVSRIDAEIASGAPYEKHLAVNNGYSFLAFNHANPANPQNGWVDENENGSYDDGEPVQIQDPHPILHDPAVRQAITHSLDYTSLINIVVFGQAQQMTTQILPSITWAFNQDIEAYSFES